MNIIFSIRHSIRNYQERPVEEEKLDEIIRAGLLAPSGCNKQAAEIIVLKNSEQQQRFKNLFNRINHRTGDPYFQAPVIAIVVALKGGSTYVCDGAIVLENMMLAAADLGLGSCWIHHVAEVFESDEGKKLLQEWKLEGEFVGIGSLALGYASGEPRPIAIRPGRVHII